LFVVNFHEVTTKKEDLEMLFEPYGKLVRIDLKRNYAFVQYSTVEEATAAKKATNGGKLDQSILSVEYVARQRTNDNNTSNTNNSVRNRPRGNDRNRNDSRDRRINDRSVGGRTNLDRGGSSSNRYNDPPLYDDRGGGGRGGVSSGRPMDNVRGRSDYRDRGSGGPPVAEFDAYRPTIYDNERYADRRASRDSPPPIPPYHHHNHHRSGRSRSRSPPSYRRRSPLRGGAPIEDDRMIQNDYRSRGRSRSPPRGGMDHRRNLSPPDRYRGNYDRDHRGYRG
jgi:RNA recognition motif-containing protein